MEIRAIKDAVHTHNKLDKKVKKAIEGLSRKLSVPQCAIINSLCAEGLESRKILKVSKTKKK